MRKFNKRRCLELMRESDELSLQGKLLCDCEKDKYQELSKYLILLSDHIFWQSRKCYLQVLESFINQKINIGEFIIQFVQLRNENLKIFEMQQEDLIYEAYGILSDTSEIDFKLNAKSRGFKKLISSLTSTLEAEMSLKSFDEEYLRSYLEENFRKKILQYCEKC